MKHGKFHNNNNRLLQRMQVQVPSDQWKYECLAQWDRECLESNGFETFKKSNSDQIDTLDCSMICSNEIRHTVCPGDTLEGLSLIYDVPIEQIKEKNSLHSHQIYYLKELTIPSAKWYHQIPQEPTHKEKISQVMEVLKLAPDQHQLCRRILTQSRWNVDRTVEKYLADVQWQHMYGHILQIFMKPGQANRKAGTQKH